MYQELLQAELPSKALKSLLKITDKTLDSPLGFGDEQMSWTKDIKQRQTSSMSSSSLNHSNWMLETQVYVYQSIKQDMEIHQRYLLVLHCGES
jgi:hypothetical protein